MHIGSQPANSHQLQTCTAFPIRCCTSIWSHYQAWQERRILAHECFTYIRLEATQAHRFHRPKPTLNCMTNALINRQHTTYMHRLLEVTPVSLLVVSRSLYSLFKVLFNFRLRYLFAIGLAVIFSLRRCIPPTSDCTLEQSYSQVWAFVRSCVDWLMCIRGFNPLWPITR